jgi:cytoskeletal protein CcmA (bactofilin family)
MIRLAVLSAALVLAAASTTLGFPERGSVLPSGIVLPKGIDIRVDVDADSDGADTTGEVHSEDVVKIGENIVIKEDDVVNGDVVCIGGNVTIAGTVNGDAVAIAGTMTLDSTAVVNGDAVAIMGRVERHDSARVNGQSVTVGRMPVGASIPFCLAPEAGGLRSVMKLGLLAKIGQFIAILAIVVLVGLFLPRPTGRLETTGKTKFWWCLLAGVLGEMVVIPGLLLLVISIVGIALIPFALIGLVAGFLFGLAGFSLIVGNIFMSKFRSNPLHPVATAAIGIFLISFLSLLGGFLGLASPGVGIGVGILGKLAAWVACTAGLGAVILTRYGTRLPAMVNANTGSAPRVTA